MRLLGFVPHARGDGVHHPRRPELDSGPSKQSLGALAAPGLPGFAPRIPGQARNDGGGHRMMVQVTVVLNLIQDHSNKAPAHLPPRAYRVCYLVTANSLTSKSKRCCLVLKSAAGVFSGLNWVSTTRL